LKLVSAFIISLSVGFLTSSENHCARWKNAAQRIQARVDPALEAQTQARGIAQAGAAIPGKDRKQRITFAAIISCCIARLAWYF